MVLDIGGWVVVVVVGGRIGDCGGGLCWLVVSVVFLDDGIYGGWSCVDGGE